MKDSQKIVLTGAAIAMVVLLAKSSKSKVDEGQKPLTETPANDLGQYYGVVLRDDGISIIDWNLWMSRTPSLIETSMLEGARDPEEITSNLFRRIFPNHPWPPVDERFQNKWNAIVAAVGRSLDRPFKPHLEIVS